MPRNITRRELLTKSVPTVAAVAGSSKLLAAGVQAAFYHGVASGDPTQSQVIIWTRITTAQHAAEVSWEVALDADFKEIAASGTVETDASKDYTVKVDVASLDAGNDYFYRFTAFEVYSPTGKTRTLPSDEVSSFRLGVCSCSNYPSGYFNAYAAMAAMDDLDLVVHLGDYIYEYDADGYASQGAEAMGRVSEPLHELTRLSDFRRRHAQYKSDSNLQDLHAKYAFILSWDDHEFANDTWRDGAENHNKGEGEWSQRKAAALQAYYEWMPIRPPADRTQEHQWRKFEFGDLATLTMLETRLSARDEQFEVAHHMLFVTGKFDVSDPENPLQVANDAAGDNIEELDLPFDFNQAEPTPIVDYRRIKELEALETWPDGIARMPDVKRFNDELLGNPERQLLGQQQRDFVAKSLRDSTAANKPWQLLGNQTLVAKVETPNMERDLTVQEKEDLAEWLKPALGWTQLGVPFGTDSWNGYLAEREWLLNSAAELDANLVVLTGDTHAAWAFDLEPEQNNADWHGVELGVTSISSPGLPEAIQVPAERFSELMAATNANLKYSEAAHRGFMTLQLTATKAIAEYHKISTMLEKHYSPLEADRLELSPSSERPGLEITELPTKSV